MRGVGCGPAAELAGVTAVLRRFEGQEGVRVIDPLQVLCSDGWCSSALDGQPAYQSFDHLTGVGARRVIEWLLARG